MITNRGIMEVIPRLYAHSKYTRYLPAVVYGSYTMAVVTPQFAQLADSGLHCIYYLHAVSLIFTLVIVQVLLSRMHLSPYMVTICRLQSQVYYH